MIKNWEYLREYKEIKAEALKAVDEVFSSGWLILGSKVKEFEETFSKYCGLKYGVGVNSGTDAIFLALKALDIGETDEVITISNTAVPTVSAIRAAGAKPVFVDVLKDTYLMDTSKIEEKITKKTKCILPVHLYGQAVEMDKIIDICKKKNIALVEDCAQSHGATYKGKMTGSFSDIAAYSFYPTKILGAYGDAGLCATNNEALAKRLKMLRMYGMDKEYYSEFDGYNSRLDEVQAAILLVKMKILDKQIKHRQLIAQRYNEGLKDLDLKLPVISHNSTHSFYLYVIQTEKRDELRQYLKENDIEARIHFPYPIHLMRGYKDLGYNEGDLANTEYLAKHILSLPISANMPLNEIDQVIAVIKKFFNK
jgi:dTDP-4-amino-4,6-dideoxygalactose transaminase